MVSWRQRSNYLSHRWGTLNYEEEETTRPQYKGVYRRDEITGGEPQRSEPNTSHHNTTHAANPSNPNTEWTIFYPTWKRSLKYCVSVPIVFGFIFCAMYFILTMYNNRDRSVDDLVNGSNEFSFSWKVSERASERVSE